jgi:CRISPR-associated protein Cas1
LHHSNRSNAFCLADDLFEPLRPLVDDRARELYRQGYDQLDTEGKSGLLKLLAEDVRLGNETGPLMVCLHRYVASLVRCFEGGAKRLEIPEMITGDAPRDRAEPAEVLAPDS